MLNHHISKDKYSRELANEIIAIPRTEATMQEIRNLYDLVNCGLTDEAIKNLVKEEGYILPKIETENIEIIARINDVKFILGDTDKLNCVKTAVKSYVEVYKQTKDIDYLVRALELVKKAKSAFVTKLNELEELVLLELPLLKASYYQLLLTETSTFLIGEQSSNVLINYFINKLGESFDQNEYHDADNCIKALNKLGHFNNEECKIQTALCLEKKADHYVSEKKPNTYYPTILKFYEDALNEIKGIIVEKAFKTRLEQKIKAEQLIFVEMLNKTAINIPSQINISQLIADANIRDFKSGFSFLMWFPIITTEPMDASKDKEDNSLLYPNFFNKSERRTEKGTISGTCDIKQHFINLTTDLARDRMIIIFQEVKQIMDSTEQISRSWVEEFVNESHFIPKGREYFFIEGFYSGFQNDFITASHILIPQIENSLKNIIELNGRNTINLTKDIQHDNTLGGIFSKKENGEMLDGICDKSLLIELNSFLTDGNSVNFRNRVCHGLIAPLETNHYGIYLWWLALKMTIQTMDYFKIPETH